MDIFEASKSSWAGLIGRYDRHVKSLLEYMVISNLCHLAVLTYVSHMPTISPV